MSILTRLIAACENDDLDLFTLLTSKENWFLDINTKSPIDYQDPSIDSLKPRHFTTCLGVACEFSRVKFVDNY